jgi:sirohydrochlorin cobaltochelatase
MTTSTTPTLTASKTACAKAVIVFAHGSRDPLWKLPVEAVAERVARAEPHAFVRCAYLELTEPDLPTVVDEFVAQLGAADLTEPLTVRVFPLFFGVGRHAREDLPAIVTALRERHPQIAFELLASAGEHAAVLDAAAAAALGTTSA